MYGWNALKQNAWKAQNMYHIIRDFNPDILGVQEEEGMAHAIMNGIGGGYAVSPSKRHGKFLLTFSTLFRVEPARNEVDRRPKAGGQPKFRAAYIGTKWK